MRPQPLDFDFQSKLQVLSWKEQVMAFTPWRSPMDCSTSSPTGKLHRNRPYVFSLDVHTHSIYVYGINRKSGEVVLDTNLTGGLSSVIKRLRKIAAPASIAVIYEAGNTGFHPKRQLAAKGFVCEIIAPSSIPHRPKEQKTDRNDAITNLHFFLNGLLRTVWIPDEDDENIRDLLRHRYTIVCNVVRIKQRISAFLKRKGLTYTLTKSRWGKTHMRWLSTCILPEPARVMLDCFLAELQQKESLLESVTDTLTNCFSGDKYRKSYQLYRQLKGVGPVNAMTLCIELGDLNRFPHPKRLMNYIGIVPRKHSSGTHDPHLSITKQGNTHVRRAVVGIAKHYRDRRGLYTEQQLRTMPEPLQSFLRKSQKRLHSFYRRLVDQRQKHSMVARVAVARELCGFLWELMVKIKPQLNTRIVLEQVA